MPHTVNRLFPIRNSSLRKAGPGTAITDMPVPTVIQAITAIPLTTGIWATTGTREITAVMASGVEPDSLSFFFSLSPLFPFPFSLFLFPSFQFSFSFLFLLSPLFFTLVFPLWGVA